MSKKVADAGENTVTATGIVQTVPIESILIDHKRNLRFGTPNAKSIAELKDNIVREGLHEPLIVSELPLPVENGFVYRLEAGYRRAEAIRLGVESGELESHVLVHVEAFTSEAQARNVNYTENDKRQELSPMDRAQAIAQMREEGLKDAEIAAIMGKSNGYISMVGKLMALLPAIQARIHLPKEDPKNLPWTLARELAGMTEAQQDKVLAERDAATLGGRKGNSKARTLAAAAAEKGETDDAGGGGEGAEGGKKKKQAISAKKAIGILNDRVAEIKAEEKVTAKQEKAVEVYTLIKRMLTASLGAQAFLRKLEEVL